MSMFLLNFKRCFMISISVFALLSPRSGLAAPDVWLEGLDDKRYNLNQYIGKGKWTVLNFWGTRCPPCLEEMPELVHFHDDHKDSNAIVVGVAIDFPSFGYARKNEVIAFVDDYLIDYPILLSDASIAEKIGAGMLRGLPTTYLYTPDGELAAMQVGGITRSILETFINKYESRNNPVSNVPDKKSE